MRPKPMRTTNHKTSKKSFCRMQAAACVLRFIVFFYAISLCGRAVAQSSYFVDGYHGGVYGHYPLEWKTRFITSSLEKYPEWRICLEIEPETWDSVAVRTPNDYRKLKMVATSPRVEFTNPTYAQPYCYNISGESIIRQFAYGIKKIRSHFPNVEFVTYSVEEPCFTSSLPQILKLFGYKYASLKCPDTCWGGYTAAYGGETVNWIGSDGSSILTSPRYECEALEENSVWQTEAWNNQSSYLKACRAVGIKHPVGMCFQDAGWRNGPWIGYGSRAKVVSKYVTWREYFEQLGTERSTEDYHFTQEELRPALMWGSQVMQRLAQQVRHTENIIPQAEKLAAMASVLNYDYVAPQAAIDEAWRTLMLAQHHDSWIVPYNNLHGKGTWADWIERWTESADSRAIHIINGAQQAMAGKPYDNGKEAVLRVWNTQGVARREVVSVALPKAWRGGGVAVKDCDGADIEAVVDGSTLTFMADVPAFGYSSYKLSPVGERVAANDEIRKTYIENDLYRISVDPERGGVINELVVKQGGVSFDYVDKASKHAMGELYGHFYNRDRFCSSMEQPARVKAGSRGDFEQWLIIEGEIASHPFSQRITIRKGSPEIDIELKIDWKHNEGIGEFMQRDARAENYRACYDDRFKLSLLFPAALGDVVVDKNAPFDVCRSKLTNTHFKSWDSIKNNVILHWVDIAQPERGGRGLALMTDHTTSYRHGKGEPLGLTVQYSGNGLWGRNYPLRGATHLRCAIVPHRGEWDKAGVEQLRASRNEPLLCSLHADAEVESRSLLSVKGTGYEVVAAYPVQQGWVVRLYNASGSERSCRVAIAADCCDVAAIDLNDNIVGSYHLKRTAEGASIDISMPRFGIKTLLIKR